MGENMFEATNPIHWWHPQVCDHPASLLTKSRTYVWSNQYPLGNWHDYGTSPFFMGKSIINGFSIGMLVYQMVFDTKIKHPRHPCGTDKWHERFRKAREQWKPELQTSKKNVGDWFHVRLPKLDELYMPLFKKIYIINPMRCDWPMCKSTLTSENVSPNRVATLKGSFGKC